MKTDPRLLRDDGDAFEKALLRSAHSDGSSARSERTLAALGLATGAGDGTGAGEKAPRGPTRSATTAGAGKATAAGLPVPWWIASIGLCALGGVAAVQTIHEVQRPSLHHDGGARTGAVIASKMEPAPSPPPATIPPIVAARPESDGEDVPVTGIPTGATLAGPQALPQRTLDSDSLTPQPAARGKFEPPAQGTTRSVSSASPAPDSLREEVFLVDRARRRLVQHDDSGAILDAEACLGRFPSGALASEAKVIRIYAVIHAEGRSAAAPLAVSFLKDYPSSPHARRLRELFLRATQGRTSDQNE